MRFKYNPWVSMVALLLLATILVLVCTGCTTEAEAATDFRLSCQFGGYAADNRLYIITDTETGTQYLLATGSGLTKLEE